MILLEDVANKSGKHDIKHKKLYEMGIDVVRVPLPVADYVLANEKALDVIERKAKRGIDVKKMDFMGTYDVAVDTKENMQEIVNNICGKQHSRFRDECILAQNNGIKLYVLVENKDGVTCLDDVFRWRNPRLDIYTRDWNNPIGYYKNGAIKYGRKQKYPSATSGSTLAKAMITMQKKYDVEFVFCTPEESANKIIELLGGAE